MPRAPFRLRPLAGLAAALLTAGVLTPAAPAAAQDGPARVEREAVPGAEVRLAGGETAETALYRLRVDDDTSLSAYGAVRSDEPDRSTAYVESGWNAVPGEHPSGDPAGPVAWIVRNSYPELEVEELAERSGAGGLSAEQAIAATQTAIWHYTEGAEPAAGKGKGKGGNHPAVLEVYRYLVDGAQGSDEPAAAPSLSVTPERIQGADPTSPIGPMKARTTGTGPVSLRVGGAEGARLTDASGETVTEVGDGEEFYLEVPEGSGAGVATVHASTTAATVQSGRAFVGKDGVTTLPLVIAEEGVTEGTAAIKADWNAPAREPAPVTDPTLEPLPSASPAEPPPAAAPPAPSPEESASPASPEPERRGPLALTGTWLGALIGIGALLVLGGAAAMLLFRRRSRRD
ncbi:thioester domain-containing protein [Nocardiopsis potens]|uniref:thioester domain-containing protein n=1 Tax=Nocardiopsis potens TaxID=1246458 RepID=UPI0003480608|nr:thioester domain-containing protein [Nocardiopsis potens]